jgi:hypothetical protein
VPRKVQNYFVDLHLRSLVSLWFAMPAPESADVRSQRANDKARAFAATFAAISLPKNCGAIRGIGEKFTLILSLAPLRLQSGLTTRGVLLVPRLV